MINEFILYFNFQMDFEGLSGRIKFENGRRKDFNLDIVELTQQGLKKVRGDTASSEIISHALYIDFVSAVKIEKFIEKKNDMYDEHAAG